MKTQIDLYTEELRERPIPYNFSMLLAVLLVTALLMLGYGLWNEQRLTALERQAKGLEAQQKALQTTITALEAELAKQDKRQALEQELARLRQANAQRERLLDVLEGHMQRPRQGFSPILRALSAAHGQGVWLTRIQLAFVTQGEGLATAGDDVPPLEVRLIGRMQRGEELPRYMDALARTQAFQGLRFRSMQAMRLEEEGELIAFLISTRADDQLDREERP